MSQIATHQQDSASRERALKDEIILRLGKVECGCSPDLATELTIDPDATKEEVLSALESLEDQGKVRRAGSQPAGSRTPYHVVFELV